MMMIHVLGNNPFIGDSYRILQGGGNFNSGCILSYIFTCKNDSFKNSTMAPKIILRSVKIVKKNYCVLS